ARKGHVRQDVLLGFPEHLCSLRKALFQAVSHVRQLRVGRRLVGLRKDGAHKGRNHLLGILRNLRQQVAHEVDPAPLPARAAQYLADVLLQPLVRVADDQQHVLQAAPDQTAQKLRPEGPVFAQATSKPSTSRSPVSLTPTATTSAMLSTRPPSRTLMYLASSHRYGYRPVSGRFRNSCTISSSSAHTRETSLLLMPVMPKACTSSSTLRVLTPRM